MKAVLVASFVLYACAAETPPVSTTTLSIETGRVVPMSTAIGRIKSAQCERTQTCATIEQRGSNWSADYCTRAERVVREDIVGPRCASIASWRLDACFEAVRLQSCQRLAESQRPPMDCGKTALCR